MGAPLLDSFLEGVAGHRGAHLEFQLRRTADSGKAPGIRAGQTGQSEGKVGI